MARGSDQAQATGASAQNYSNQLQGNSGALYGSLMPSLQAEATHPAGYAPADLASMNTAAQQTAGGSQAAAVGQGALRTARTKNQGSADAAIADSTRSAGQNLSRAGLGVQMKNADLKQHQQQEGLQGMEGLYGTNVSGALGGMNAANGAVNANTNAANASWDWSKDLLAPIMGAASNSKYV